MLKIDRFVLSIFMLALLVPLDADDGYAAAIVLKTGQQIPCREIRQDAGAITCADSRYQIDIPTPDVDRIIAGSPSGQGAVGTGFSVGIWRSGMRKKDVLDIAEKNDITFHRHGETSASQSDNAKMSRSFIYTATGFYYNDHLMGKPARVNLFFTPLSNLLVRIKAHIYSQNIDQETFYPKEVKDRLTAKYGMPSRPVTTGRTHESIFWTVDEAFTVLMETGAGRVDVTYSDLPLQAIGKYERDAIKSNPNDHLK